MEARGHAELTLKCLVPSSCIQKETARVCRAVCGLSLFAASAAAALVAIDSTSGEEKRIHQRLPYVVSCITESLLDRLMLLME